MGACTEDQGWGRKGPPPSSTVFSHLWPPHCPPGFHSGLNPNSNLCSAVKRIFLKFKPDRSYPLNPSRVSPPSQDQASSSLTPLVTFLPCLHTGARVNFPEHASGRVSRCLEPTASQRSGIKTNVFRTVCKGLCSLSPDNNSILSCTVFPLLWWIYPRTSPPSAPLSPEKLSLPDAHGQAPQSVISGSLDTYVLIC